MFFSLPSIAVTLLGEEKANLSAFRTFVRFVLVWFCRFPLPHGVWEGLRFVIVALPGLFSYFCFLNDIIIVGDFNNDMLNPTALTKLIYLTSSYNFHQLIDEPTHYTENSFSLIDLVLVSKPENVL